MFYGFLIRELTGSLFLFWGTREKALLQEKSGAGVKKRGRQNKKLPTKKKFFWRTHKKSSTKKETNGNWRAKKVLCYVNCCECWGTFLAGLEKISPLLAKKG